MSDRAQPGIARAVSEDSGSAAMKAPFIRLLFLLPGAVALLAGLDAALILLGLPTAVTTVRLAQLHGPLMVFGFVSTVICLERAVALRQWWGYASPVLIGLGSLATLTPLDVHVGQIAVTVGCAVLVAIYVGVWQRQGTIALAIQALGGVLAVVAALLWARGLPVNLLVPSMSGFLLLTIAGERLELARVGLLKPRAAVWALVPAVGIVVGVTAALLWPQIGYPLFGIALIAQVVWLIVHDVATNMVRARGLPRYIAWCLLCGYVWLAVAGGIWIILGPVESGPGFDASTHAVFLGFVISMIMAHAPVILPAVLRRPLPYRPMLYAPVALLQLSLLIRVIGDARGVRWVIQLGGGLNVLALLLFVGMAAGLVIRSSVRKTVAAQRREAQDARPTTANPPGDAETAPGTD